MPLFTYTNRSGQSREFLVRATQDRLVVDGVEWVKTPVQAFAVAGARPLPTQREQVLDGYYREECAGRPWRSHFSKNQIKRIWSDEP